MANSKVNTTKTIFKDSQVSDAELAAKAMEANKKIIGSTKVEFYCDPVYHSLYPNGFESTFQGVHVYLIFDGRTVKLSKPTADFVKMKLKKKALAEITKQTRNKTQKQEYLGMEYVS